MNKDFFLNIINKNIEIDNVNLIEYLLPHDNNKYFLKKTGEEHYKFLSYLSTVTDDILILDIGTYLGHSAIALSFNSKNTVNSFDVQMVRNVNNKENINYYIDDVFKYRDLVLSSKIILLDTNHTGEFEQDFFNFLIDINYKGILILDDIHLNKEMLMFWDAIKIDKLDITKIGHVTGTGLVFFN